jgi:hypothetical protein
MEISLCGLWLGTASLWGLSALGVSRPKFLERLDQKNKIPLFTILKYSVIGGGIKWITLFQGLLGTFVQPHHAHLNVCFVAMPFISGMLSV